MVDAEALPSGNRPKARTLPFTQRCGHATRGAAGKAKRSEANLSLCADNMTLCVTTHNRKEQGYQTQHQHVNNHLMATAQQETVSTHS